MTTGANNDISATGGTGQRLHLLDGLRGVAAFGVLLFHLPGFFPVFEPMARGYLFVDLFFLLSGFVLTPVIAGKNAQGMQAWDFFKARFVRFWPLVAVGTVLAAFLFSLTPGADMLGIKLAFALAFIPVFFIAEAIFPLNVVQWSLLWELLANGAHAKWWDRWRDRAIAAMVAIAGLIYGTAIVVHETANLGAHGHNFLYAAPRIVFSYGMGMLIARHFKGARDVSWPGWLARIALPVIAVALLPMAGLALPWVEAAIVLLVFPACFWLIAHCRPATAWDRLLAWLGSISFPLYAVHMPILIATQMGTFLVMGDITWHGALVAPVAVILASAWLAKKMEPGRVWRKARQPAGTASPA